MEIPCPKCRTLNTDAKRHPLTKRETGLWVCHDCNYIWTPLDEQVPSVDLADRIAVLEALEQNVESRCLAVSIPQEMIAMAQNFEQQASELLQKANRIRETLKHDTGHIKDLMDEWRAIRLEILACRHCQHAKIKPTKSMLAHIVKQFMQ